MSLLLIKRMLGMVPGWIYAAVIIGVAFLFYALHLIGQRDDAREDLRQANTRIETLVAQNATLTGNNARLESGVAAQNKSIDAAAAEAKRKQLAAAQALAAADAKYREQAARIKALKAIQEAGDRSKGANYAFEARRAQR